MHGRWAAVVGKFGGSAEGQSQRQAGVGRPSASAPLPRPSAGSKAFPAASPAATGSPRGKTGSARAENSLPAPCPAPRPRQGQNGTSAAVKAADRAEFSRKGLESRGSGNKQRQPLSKFKRKEQSRRAAGAAAPERMTAQGRGRERRGVAAEGRGPRDPQGAWAGAEGRAPRPTYFSYFRYCFRGKKFKK